MVVPGSLTPICHTTSSSSGVHPLDTNPAQQIVTRAVAAVALVIVLPAIAVVALASFLSYRTSPFFMHERVGFRGASLRLVKIRTLPPTVDQYADKYSLREHHVPRVMNLVRRLHLDELPQLLHVVRGEMAFVGPRPEMHFLYEKMSPSFADERTSVLPGLTGLWQVSVDCSGLISECPEYDRFYLQHRSRALNLWILVRTASKMLSGRTVDLTSVPGWTLGPAAVAQESSTAA